MLLIGLVSLMIIIAGCGVQPGKSIAGQAISVAGKQCLNNWYYFEGGDKLSGPFTECTEYTSPNAAWCGITGEPVTVYASGGVEGVDWKYCTLGRNGAASAMGCAEGVWYYDEGNNQITQQTGCTEYTSPGAPWCAMNSAVNSRKAYFSGGVEGKDWDYCGVQQQAIEPVGVGMLAKTLPLANLQLSAYDTIKTECMAEYEEGCTDAFLEKEVMTSKLVGSDFAVYYYEQKQMGKAGSVQAETAKQVLDQVYAGISTEDANMVATVLLYEAVAKKKLAETQLAESVALLEKSSPSGVDVGMKDTSVGGGVGFSSQNSKWQQTMAINAGMKGIMAQIDNGGLSKDILEKLKKKEDGNKDKNKNGEGKTGGGSAPGASASGGGSGLCMSGKGKSGSKGGGKTDAIGGLGGGAGNPGASMAGDEAVGGGGGSKPDFGDFNKMPSGGDGDGLANSQYSKDKKSGKGVPCQAVNWPKLMGDGSAGKDEEGGKGDTGKKATDTNKKEATPKVEKPDIKVQSTASDSTKKAGPSGGELVSHTSKQYETKDGKGTVVETKVYDLGVVPTKDGGKEQLYRTEVTWKSYKDDFSEKTGQGKESHWTNDKPFVSCDSCGSLQLSDPNAESTNSGSNPYNKCGEQLAASGYTSGMCLFDSLGGESYKPMTGCDLLGMPGEGAGGGACGKKKQAKAEDLDLGIFFSDPTGIGASDPNPADY